MGDGREGGRRGAELGLVPRGCRSPPLRNGAAVCVPHQPVFHGRLSPGGGHAVPSQDKA